MSTALPVESFYSNVTGGRRTRQSRRLTDLDDGSDADSKGSEYQAESSDDEGPRHPKRHVYLRRHIEEDSDEDGDGSGKEYKKEREASDDEEKNASGNEQKQEENEQITKVEESADGKEEKLGTAGENEMRENEKKEDATLSQTTGKYEKENDTSTNSHQNESKSDKSNNISETAVQEHESAGSDGNDKVCPPKDSVLNEDGKTAAAKVPNSNPIAHTPSPRNTTGEGFNGLGLGPLTSHVSPAGPTRDLAPPPIHPVSPLTTNQQRAPPAVGQLSQSPTGFPSFNPRSQAQSPNVIQDGMFGVTSGGDFPFPMARSRAQTAPMFGQANDQLTTVSTPSQFVYGNGSVFGPTNQFSSSSYTGQQQYDTTGKYNNFGAAFQNQNQSTTRPASQYGNYSTTFTDFFNFGTNYAESQSKVTPYQKSPVSVTQSLGSQTAGQQFQGHSQYQQPGYQSQFSPSPAQFSPSHTTQQYSPRLTPQFSQQQVFTGMSSQYTSPPAQQFPSSQVQFPLPQSQAPYAGTASPFTNMAPSQSGNLPSSNQFVTNNRTYPDQMGTYFPPTSSGGSASFDAQGFS